MSERSGTRAPSVRGDGEHFTRGQTFTVPVLPLAGDIVFPRTAQPLTLQGEHAANVARAAVSDDGYVALFLNQAAAENAIVQSVDLAPVGTLARLDGVTWNDDGTVQVSAEGLHPIRLLHLAHKDTHTLAAVELLQIDGSTDEGIAALATQARSLFKRLLDLAGSGTTGEIARKADEADDQTLAYLIASSMPISPAGKQALLETHTLSAKFVTLISYLNKALQLSEAHGIAPVSPSPGAAHLDPATLDRVELEEKLRAAHLSPEARAAADNELQRMSLLSPGSPEYNMARSYVGWLADLPWGGADEAEIDLDQATAMLDRDHYGLDDIKRRIVDHLAVRKLRAARSADDGSEHQGRNIQPILCLVGPPGVGKTSLGRSIAEALGREFVRISLGGVTDEAEIRGHRRTYLGALPGRIIQSLARSRSHQPVIMLDELDKLGANGKSDPSSALLDVLDPEQQREFVDHYLGIPFDISCVFFLATANTLEQVPEALRDRLEVIRIAGYTEEEKVEIANRHLIPRQMGWHALEPDDVTWEPDASRHIIHLYTREAGVRQLDREIATICRRIASDIAQAEDDRATPQVVTGDLVTQILGTPRFLPAEPLDTDQSGVVTGAFWTAAGGDIMHIEALLMPGGKTLTVTGQLGDVMQESAQAALSYVRAHAEQLGIAPDFYESNDLHVHIPSGAVAKDGPSAGVAIALALVSLLTGRPVRRELAVTGELTLRGKILPVGGIKEKLLAARRAGMKVVIIPAQNQPDLDDIESDLLSDIEVLPVESVDEALAAAF
jgi:ATP-dependent Lon protease